MNDRKIEMMEFVKNLPYGVPSKEGRYFCETCKNSFCWIARLSVYNRYVFECANSG